MTQGKNPEDGQNLEHLDRSYLNYRLLLPFINYYVIYLSLEFTIWRYPSNFISYLCKHKFSTTGGPLLIFLLPLFLDSFFIPLYISPNSIIFTTVNTTPDSHNPFFIEQPHLFYIFLIFQHYSLHFLLQLTLFLYPCFK